MQPEDKRTSATRAETDASLRAERAKADEELTWRDDQLGRAIDAAVRTSRTRTDAARDARRHREDAMGETSDDLKAERSRHDAAIAQDRLDGDLGFAAERVRGQVAVASLLLAERQETDARLLLERSLSDVAITRRDDFLAMLSHDMRSLLATVALNAALLGTDGKANPAIVARCGAAIQRTTARMTRLVADLLDVASVDAGKLVLIKSTHDAARLVREVAAAFKPTATEKDLTLSVDVPEEMLASDLDPDRIAQVLANLLGNAAKFTPSGGTIRLGVTAAAGEVRFFVADTGVGIPADRLRSIFERYAQLGRTDRTGLGLGLYIAHRIVAAHGGRLWAESTLGRGSTFHFTLPARA